MEGYDMLVLTRRRNEEIVIADTIIVKVIEIKGNAVRLGFEAAPDVTIYRKEIYDQIALANKMAASVCPEDIEKLQQ